MSTSTGRKLSPLLELIENKSTEELEAITKLLNLFFVSSSHNIDKSSLTPREKQIYNLTLNMYSSQEIADELHISRHTVDTHRRHIRKKMRALRNI